MGIYLTIIFLLLLTTIIASTHYITHTAHNKAQHTLNGNNTLNLLHWNKGKSHFHNKTNDIDNILSLNKPHIFSICEANAKKEKNDNPFNNYMDYKIEHTKMSDTTNQSRNILMIKEDIIYIKEENNPCNNSK